MKHMRNKLMALLAAFPFAAVAEDLDITRSIASDATVTVSNIAGSIEIATWGRDEVHLTGYTGNNQELLINENDRGISFEIDRVNDNEDSDESVLILTIPVGASIVATGVSADIQISGSEGASVTAESVSGDIDVEADSERVDLSVVSGDLEFRGSSSRTTAEAVSGDIELTGVSGEVTITTVSGDAILEAVNLQLGKFESVSGSIDLSLSAEDGARLVVESMSGDVRLDLPASQLAEFFAQSFSGDISTDFGEVKQEKFGPGSHLKHVSGNSGTVIRVESFSGDIHIGHK